MDGFFQLFRGITWQRAGFALLLATAATAIVKPYFIPWVTFPQLLMRMVVTATVMFLAFVVAGNLRIPRLKREHAQYAALILGAFFGPILAGLLLGRTFREMFTEEGKFLGIVVLSAAGISVGVIAAMLAAYRERSARAEAELRARMAQADAARHSLERQVLEAQLKLMQAQIEPHFLFNTLANVQHLVEANPPLASRTLESLIVYLRAALPQMREQGTTLGREADMARAYLDIQQLRMGKRLSFNVDVPHALRERDFPPMMLMTLVENAIKHGIDPLQQGGEIRVSATATENALDVSVADTGQGLSHSAGMGIGLQNIRERLQALYRRNARLLLEENSPCGVVARIRIESPVDAGEPDTAFH